MPNHSEPPKTVASSLASLAPLPDSPKTDPQKARTIIALLAKLAIHPSFQPYGDLTPAQFEILASDFVNDLCEFAIVEIESAIISYRQDPKSKGFPTPGRLRELCLKAKAARAEVRGDKLKPQYGESRPNWWWAQDRRRWKAHWREEDVPFNEKVRDEGTGELRDPIRRF